MKKRVSIETWNAEMLCRKPSVTGCVFPTFDASVHVRDNAFDVASSPNTLAIDFGFANPFVCLWIATSGETVFVFDEYVQPQRMVNEHVEHIATRPWPKTKRIVCDPAGAGRSDQTATSNIQLLRAAGYTVKTKRSNIVEGLELIRSALKPASGEPRLFIHPRCTRLIKAMQSYRYPDGGGELPLKDGEFDHPIDALRYFFVNDPARDAVKVRAY